MELPDDLIEKKRVYMRDYMRDYVRFSLPVMCDCGAVFKSYNRCVHNKTKKHTKWLEMCSTIGLGQLEELRIEVEQLKLVINAN
jgi:hypothetical protein